MRQIRFRIVAVIAASLCAAPGAARADATMGTLIYHFTYSSKQNVTARDSTDNAATYGNMTTLYQTTLNLVSDSMAKT